MRDLPKARYRASSACKSQVSVNRACDVTSFRVGRAHAQGDTCNADGRYVRPHRPMRQYLKELPRTVAGLPLSDEEAEHWAIKMRHRMKGK